MPKQFIDPTSLEIIRGKLWERSQSSGITLEDIQDRTDFSYSQVYRIVRGKNNVSVSHLIAVCKALEIQPSTIFDFEVVLPKYPKVRRELKSKK